MFLHRYVCIVFLTNEPPIAILRAMKRMRKNRQYYSTVKVDEYLDFVDPILSQYLSIVSIFGQVLTCLQLLCLPVKCVGAVMAVDWLPDGKRVVTASLDNTAKLWDAEQSTVIQTLTGIDIFLCFN